MIDEKPKPKVSANETVCRCRKCGGSGMYAECILDGRPYSSTGTMCWSCGGAGWIIRFKPGKAPKRKLMVLVYVDGKPHHYAEAK